MDCEWIYFYSKDTYFQAKKKKLKNEKTKITKCYCLNSFIVLDFQMHLQ